MGFSYSSATPSLCSEAFALAVSNFNSREPICVFSTESSGEIKLSVSNLRTTGSPTPSTYSIVFNGLKNGPAARSSQINGNSATGTYGKFYAGDTETE